MFKRMTVKAFLMLGLAILAPAVYATEDLQWFGSADGYGASLIYGVPQSGYAPIAFQCQDSGEIGFVFEFEPINPADGITILVTLEAGGISIPIETRGSRLEMDDLFILEGKYVPGDDLSKLLAASDYLSVFVEDGAEEYPLDGALEAARALFETCQ